MEIKKIAEVNQYVDPTIDIVFFDIDNTILETEGGPNLVSWAIALENHIRSHQRMKNLSAHDFFMYMQHHLADFIEHMKPALVEDEVLGIIHSIEQRDIPIIALTNRPIQSFETTVKQLRKFGLDFASHPFVLQEHYFETLERAAYFREGVIIGNSNNKGLLVREFFEKTGFRPKKLLFVDDSAHFISEVENVLKGTATEVVGLRYGFLDEKGKGFVLTSDMVPEELR